MNTKIDPIAFGYTGAIISSIGMFVMWVLGGMGYYTEAVIMMQGWHIFFSLNFTGLIGGIIEAAIFSFITLYLFGLLYNKLAK